MDTIQRFIQCSGYPDEPQKADGGRTSLLIDGAAIEAQQLPDGGLRISCQLDRPASFPNDQEFLALALRLAFPRMLKDNCSLAWEPDAAKLLLWTQFQPAEDDDEFLAQWEELLNARDWWLRELDRNAPAPAQEDSASPLSTPMLFFRP